MFFQILKKRHQMDCFSFIKMVNYIRAEKPSPALVMSLASDDLWKKDTFMKPVCENDSLLMVDIEDDIR
jgi:protein arginine N-methyltransferase 3